MIPMRGASFVAPSHRRDRPAVGCYQAPRDAPCTVSCAGQTATCPSGSCARAGSAPRQAEAAAGMPASTWTRRTMSACTANGHGRGPTPGVPIAATSRDETIPDGTEYEFCHRRRRPDRVHRGCDADGRDLPRRVQLADDPDDHAPRRQRLASARVPRRRSSQGPTCVISVGEEPGNLLSRAEPPRMRAEPRHARGHDGCRRRRGRVIRGPGGGGGTGNGGDAQDLSLFLLFLFFSFPRVCLFLGLRREILAFLRCRFHLRRPAPE